MILCIFEFLTEFIIILVVVFYSVSDFHLFQLACRPHSPKPNPYLLYELIRRAQRQLSRCNHVASVLRISKSLNLCAFAIRM